MTEVRTPVEIAVAFIEAFARRDMVAVAAHLAENVVFESPRVTVRGAESFLQAVGQFAQAVTGVRIVSALGDDREAMIMYDMETGPFGTLRSVDRIVVQDGKIISDILVFDTYEVRKATEG
ncbi:nuclear transport factor 2 family protein [Actinopolymorpha pittospori]|nr:nuclear transport factor 2 family protein [Actinopolymorpha pittospori]